MERRPERPWMDYEKMELLTNIIRVSNLTPFEVFQFIAQRGIPVVWELTPIPHDRTLAECQRQFDQYRAQMPYTARAPGPVAPSTQYPMVPGPSYIGPLSRPMYETQPPGRRQLLPKTAPSTPSEAGPVYPQSPMTEAPTTRKRGRPPKEEVSRRKAEAEMRGEPYPPPRSKRRNRSSLPQEAPSPSVMTPLTAPAQGPSITTPTGPPPAETGSESSGSKRRRLRPADIETTGAGPPTTSYESPPQTSFTQAQPSASTTSGRDDAESRMEGVEETARPTYRDIVGIQGSSG